MAKTNSVWYVYMIRSSDNSLYTGITTDPKRRLTEHQTDPKKQAKYFKGRQALSIAYLQIATSRSEASKLEAGFKKLSKHKKEQIVAEYQHIHLAQLT
ncbi:GIY-YIG nuclease family protein [Catenovulum sp. 2E275]|uniref:GIY-YIG nuclease family protein n=1 Tax=Catenovulum sp. 2E275 TaxID=2980497 RepID=UPI0021D02965|nr:GIY-YIG nuclease family protein [Catenovulum sp. 2E275]MCU4674863.1 GIY-YIG nuclease family protein [Catenovulum sp. 2E275]